MRIRIQYLALLVVAPLAVLIASARLGRRTRLALFVTVPVTWSAATIGYLLTDPNELMPGLLYMFFVMPMVIAPFAGVVATLVIDPRKELIPGILAAVLGCVLGLALSVAISPDGADDRFWAAVAVGPAAIFAACAAVVAASLAEVRNRRPLGQL